MKAKPIYEVTGNFDVSKAIIIKAKLIKKLGNDFHIIILSDKNIKEIKTKIIYPRQSLWNFIFNRWQKQLRRQHQKKLLVYAKKEEQRNLKINIVEKQNHTTDKADN